MRFVPQHILRELTRVSAPRARQHKKGGPQAALNSLVHHRSLFEAVSKDAIGQRRSAHGAPQTPSIDGSKVGAGIVACR